MVTISKFNWMSCRSTKNIWDDNTIYQSFKYTTTWGSKPWHLSPTLHIKLKSRATKRMNNTEEHFVLQSTIKGNILYNIYNIFPIYIYIIYIIYSLYIYIIYIIYRIYNIYSSHVFHQKERAKSQYSKIVLKQTTLRRYCSHFFD